MIAIFTDAQGREWHPRFTFTAVTTIREKLGLDLLKPIDPSVLADTGKLLAMFHVTVQHEEPDENAFREAVDAGPFAPMIQAFNNALGVFMNGPDYEPPTDDEEPSEEQGNPT